MVGGTAASAFLSPGEMDISRLALGDGLGPEPRQHSPNGGTINLLLETSCMSVEE